MRAAGDVEVTSSGMSTTRAWIASHRTADDGAGWTHFSRDRERRAPALLVTAGARRRAARATQPVIISPRDGLNLVCYLDAAARAGPDSEPGSVGAAWSTAARGRATLPDFNTTHQLLANRGYAVLSVNFRGSTGFGKAFVNAGNREWGGRCKTTCSMASTGR